MTVEEMKRLYELKLFLRELLVPDVLSSLLSLLKELGEEDESMLDRYMWWIDNSVQGEDCRYAQVTKTIFEKESSFLVAQKIKDIYENWAKEILCRKSV
jgi:hypothetical protein